MGTSNSCHGYDISWKYPEFKNKLATVAMYLEIGSLLGTMSFTTEIPYLEQESDNIILLGTRVKLKREFILKKFIWN